MAEPTFTESYELLGLAKKLQERYHFFLGQVDLEAIWFTEALGEKPKTAKVASISGITKPWLKQLLAKMDKNNKLYCLSVWSQEWENLSPAQREWAVFHCLYAVAPEAEGKMRKPDVQGYGPIIDFLGPYWERRQDLPSMLDGDEPLPIPPPPADEEDDEIGSTI